MAAATVAAANLSRGTSSWRDGTRSTTLNLEQRLSTLQSLV